MARGKACLSGPLCRLFTRPALGHESVLFAHPNGGVRGPRRAHGRPVETLASKPDFLENLALDNLLSKPYGRIVEIIPPSPVPAGDLRHSTVRFSSVHAAAAARNCIHGYRLATADGKITRLSANFERPLKAHNVRDWLIAPSHRYPNSRLSFGHPDICCRSNLHDVATGPLTTSS